MFKVVILSIIFLVSFPIISNCQNDTSVINDSSSLEQLNYELLVFAYKGESENIKLWLEKGADVNAISSDGISALMYAAQNGYLLALKVLIANGADINYRPYGKVSALSSAVISNKIEIVDYLLFKNADVNIRDDQNITPLMYSSAYGYYNITQLLLNYKADKNLKDEYGNDALMLAVEYNHPEICELLISYGADVNTTDNEGFTPIQLASQNGWLWYVDLLQSNGADLAKRNNYGCNGLDVAIINHQKEFIENFNKIDTSGKFINTRPVKLAYISGNRDMVKVLRKSGFPSYVWPIFDKISMGYGADLNLNDFMLGFNFGIRESRYNIVFGVSHHSRYWAKRILLNYGNDIYYQFWERRSLLGFSIDKRLKLSGSGNKQNGVSLGLMEGFTYGHYRGSEIIPARKWMTIPRLGFYTEGKYGGLSATLEYVDFKTEKDFPMRVNINTYIYIGLRNFSNFKKVPEW